MSKTILLKEHPDFIELEKRVTKIEQDNALHKSERVIGYSEGKKIYTFINNRLDDIQREGIITARYVLINRRKSIELMRFVASQVVCTPNSNDWSDWIQMNLGLKVIVSDDVSDCQIIVI
jgi:hypothetical protein